MALTYTEREKCGSIIHLASAAAALVGSGMAQIPLSDAVLIAPIQINMITALGDVFGIKLTESAAKGLCAALSASCIGRAASQLLLGWIPILGNIINAGTAAGITEAMGWLVVEHFQEPEYKKAFKHFGEKTKNFFAECLEGLEENLRTDQSDVQE